MPPFLNLPFLEQFRCAVLWNPADIAPEYCINFFVDKRRRCVIIEMGKGAVRKGQLPHPTSKLTKKIDCTSL